MATKPPTKKQFQELLEKEIQAWEERICDLDGAMKEQAIGRMLECEWLLNEFIGNK